MAVCDVDRPSDVAVRVEIYPNVSLGDKILGKARICIEQFVLKCLNDARFSTFVVVDDVYGAHASMEYLVDLKSAPNSITNLPVCFHLRNGLLRP